MQRLVWTPWASNPPCQSDDVSIGPHDGLNSIDHIWLVHKIEKVNVSIPHILQMVVAFDVHTLTSGSYEVWHLLLVRARGWKAVVPPFLGLQAEDVSNELVAVIRLELGGKANKAVRPD